jgi:hypothetical protein
MKPTAEDVLKLAELVESVSDIGYESNGPAGWVSPLAPGEPEKLVSAAKHLRAYAASLTVEPPDQWKALETLCEEASPEPWTAENAQDGIPDGCAWGVISGPPEGEQTVVVLHDFVSPRNAAFIAAARTAVPELLRALKGKLDWQPIETAPKDGAGYLVFPTPLFGADQAGVAYWDRDEGYECWRDLEGERLDPQPTHWMPLPAAPREEAKP